jgi:virulence factor
MTAVTPLTIAVVGCGWIARSIYAPILLSLGDSVRVLAICDLDASAALAMAARFKGSTSFSSVAAMLEKTTLDAVLVLTSEGATAAVVVEILKAGIPVFVEKPPAMNSAELEELIKAEGLNQAFAYTAFNRRHVPLFYTLAPSGAGFRRISGVMKRVGRTLASFPTTAIHLIDSAQYYGQSLFRNWEITFSREDNCSVWTIEGVLENGAACQLRFVPDGDVFAESLFLEAKSGAWELRFPNSDAGVPEGERIFRRGDGSPEEVTRGQAGLDSFEAMGFRSCLLDFIQHARTRKAPLLNRAASSRSSIRIMQEMEARIPSA